MKTVKDYILEAKFVSKLMLDLSYLALEEKNEDINDDVKELYEKIRIVERELIKILFKIKVNDDERLVMIEFIDQIKDICNSTLQNTQLVKSEIFPQILMQSLEEDEEKMIRVRVKKGSFLEVTNINKKRLEQVSQSKIKAIKRDTKWFFKNGDGYEFKEGDVIIATGNSISKSLLTNAATKKSLSL